MRGWLNIARHTLYPKLCAKCRRVVEDTLLNVSALRAEFREIRSEILRQRAVAPRVCDQLLAAPRDRQISIVRSSYTKYETRPVVEELLRRSEERIVHDPEESLRLAILAEEAVEKIDRRHRYAGGLSGVADLLALTRAAQGNAFRVLRLCNPAASRFESAFSSLMRGTGDALTVAKVSYLYASLLKDREDYFLALEHLKKAEELYSEVSEAHWRGRVMVNRAIVLDEMLEPVLAISVLREALSLLDGEKDPMTMAMGYHNLSFYLCEVNRYEQAAAAQDKSDQLFRWLLPASGSQTEAYRTWVRGKVSCGLGHSAEAEKLYKVALERFREFENPTRIGLVSLDLAVLYFEEQRFEDLATIAEETYEALRSQELHPEAEHALLLFRRAAQRRQVALEVIRAAAEQLKRHQRCSGSALC